MPKRCLIVDDIASNQKLMAVFMEDFGFKLTFAENGEEALKILEKEPCDLILLDLNMPKMDGTSTIEHIRSRDWDHKHIPIIVLTAFGSKRTREKCFLLGVNDIVLKPISFPRLEKILKEMQLI